MGHGGFICYPECIIHLLFDNLAIYDLGGAVNLFRGNFVAVFGSAMRCVSGSRAVSDRRTAGCCGLGTVQKNMETHGRASPQIVDCLPNND